ncbi:hypothetical protein [Chloroflexus sp.]|uniref:nSTAND1 domain-containing NTPase n=1 Tax=Chloroflexus sp. TaxID=1904827 RepID=UPI00298F29A9|nr:hypothetical protein [Chloroflexus sp.]MDW8402734.1 hypothetical protein [Chloroflexus sp.]
MNTLRQNPYLGPRAFTREHRLYGRDRELRDLTSLLVAERIVLLYSPSGAGKSSLVQAALIPTLEARRFRVLPIVRVGLALPAAAPLATNRYLAAAALSIGGDEALDRSLTEFITPSEQVDPDDTVIIFDQFEELLTVDPLNRAAKEAFCRTVGDLLRANRHLWALFVIREDYLAPMMEYAHFFPSRFRNTFRLDLLGPEAALAAIRRPALDAGVEFELAAARSLVDDLRRARVQSVSDQVETMLGATVEPVQLQVVCFRLWQRLFPTGAPAGAAITATALSLIGSVDEALADYYADRVAAAAAASGVRERVIRDWFDQQLITAGGIRNQVLRGEGATAGLPNAALPPLINAYLIRAEQRRNFTWYELAHDRLIEPVRQNNAAWRERLAPVQRQAALWAATDRPQSLLLRDADLVAAQAWAAAHPEQVEQIDTEFLKACVEHQAEIDADRRRDRLIQWLGIVSAVLAVVMLIAAAAAFFAYQEADRLSRLARARELAAEAAVNLSVDPQLSLLLARQAVLVHRKRNEQVDLAAEAILYRALAVSRARETVDLGAPVTALAVSDDGRWWAAATHAETGVVEVVLVERASGQMQQLAGASDHVAALTFSPDSSKLVAVTWDGTLLMWETGNPQPANRWVRSAVTSSDAPIQQAELLADRLLDVRFAPDGRTVYTAGYDGWLRQWDLASGRQVVVGGEEGNPLVSMTIDPAGTRIAAGTQTGDLLVWQLRDGRLIERQTIGTQPIYALEYTLDGKLAFVEGVRLLEAGSDDDAIGVLATFGATLNDLWLSPDRSLALLASNDGNDYLVNLSNGKTITILRGHDDQISHTRWLANGREAITASFDGTVRFWAVGDIQRFTPVALAADPQQGRLAVGGEDGAIALFRDPTGPAQLLLHHRDVIEMLAFSPDGRWLAAASADGEASIWEVATGRLRIIIPHEARVRTVAFNADGTLLLTSSRLQAYLWRWQESTTRPLVTLNLGVHRKTDIITSTALHPTQPRLAIVTRDGQTLMWDYRAMQIVVEAADNRANGRVGFSPDGSLVLSESNEGILLLRDSATLRLRDFPAFHRGGIAGFAFDPSGTLIATVGFDQTAKIWRIADGVELVRMGTDGLPVAIAFSSAGEVAIAGANGSVVRLPIDIAQALDLALARSRRPTAEECERYQLAREDPALCPGR